MTGRFTQVFGIDSCEMIGRQRVDIMAPELIHPDAVEAHVLCLNNHRSFKKFVFPTRVCKRGVLWIRTSGNPLYDESDVLIGFRGSGSDAATEMEARREAEIARTRLSDALRRIRDGFALYDADGRLVLYDENYAREFGANRDILKIDATFDSRAREHIRRGYVIL